MARPRLLKKTSTIIDAKPREEETGEADATGFEGLVRLQHELLIRRAAKSRRGKVDSRFELSYKS